MTSTTQRASGIRPRLPSALRKGLRRVLANLGLQVISKNSAAPAITDDLDFHAIQDKCAPYTMTTVERQYALYQATKYLVARRIQGAFVECGVWRGGAAMMMAHTLLACQNAEREIFLYDTFTGMTEPTEKDVSNRGAPALQSWRRQQRKSHNEWCYASLDEVRQNLALTGYPASKFHLIQGKVEDTIPQRAPDAISLLRLDTDWFESTYHELKHLFPRLVPGGVLIIDDYGRWRGAREATDRYLAEVGKPLLLQRVDKSARLALNV
jgi:hypothetical protein